MNPPTAIMFFFFFNDTATTEIYTLSLHDALPISRRHACRALEDRERRFRSVPHPLRLVAVHWRRALGQGREIESDHRSEEHTSELQSQSNLVCRLLLEKKKKKP